MIVIIAEKPSVARDIAAVVGANEKKDGYVEGNGYQVTWAFGHLVKLADAQSYDEKYKMWRIDDLPIVPAPFIYEAYNDPAKQKQIRIIRDLFFKAQYIIVATDAGREGEAIFRYIYNYVGCKTEFKRLWISSLTETAIREGLANLKPGRDYDDLYYSAKCRGEADWLVGINSTRALTVSSQSRTPLSLGRVQTPTLAIIVSRFLENQQFTPTPYFVPDILLDYNKNRFKAYLKDSNFKTSEECSAAIAKIAPTVRLIDKKTSNVSEKAPLPYDLTSLQADANRRYKFKAQKTLDIMQALYEKHKVLTYPRTASRYLGTDMIEPIKENIKKLSSLPYNNIGESIKMIGEKFNNKCFDNSKLTDHHAVIPTFENLDKLDSLSADERKIFDMATRQLIMALMPPCNKIRTSYSFSDDLYANGSVITFPGWRLFCEPEKPDEDDDDENIEAQLPDLPDGCSCLVAKKEVKQKMTKKPPLHSEASLLKAMETAGQLIDDDELKAAIKECGIGTPATRAAIIESLFARNYIEEQKNKLVPTELGIKIYESTKNLPIASPKLTGDWECKLNRMAEGKFMPDVFQKEIKSFTAELTSNFAEIGKSLMTATENNVGICPLCGKKVIERQMTFSCVGNRKDNADCSFVIWKEIAKKKISATTVSNLLQKGKSELVKGFTSKAGKKFDAFLVLKSDKSIGFEFPPSTNTSSSSSYKKKGGTFKK